MVGLSITGPDGRVRQLRRQFDPEQTTAALRSLAVNAETSVNARVFEGYERVKTPDGGYQPETYAFGEGGLQLSSPVADDSIDHMSFEQIVLTLAPAMAAQGYVPATDLEQTDLAVMVYWGATATDENPAVISSEMLFPANHEFRNQMNRLNARLLGFEEALRELAAMPLSFRSSRHADLTDDLEESRYWVALVAIDYQAIRTEQVIQPLWSIRYNMRSRGTGFGRALQKMTQFASHYFGRDSNGLVNRAVGAPAGTVEIGEAEVVDYETETNPESSQPMD